MKKIYLILTFAATTVLCLNAQLKMKKVSHGIVAGDAHHFLFTEPVNNVGMAGKNRTWDFSNVKENGKTLTSHMFSAIETPKGSLIKNANSVIEEFGNFFYFKETENEIEHVGYISGNTIMIYDKPLLKLKFPLTYGDKFAGEYSGTQTSGSVNAKFSGSYEIACDAAGKLILPNGVAVNNTIRVKQSRTYNCPTGCNYSEVIYRWYGKDVHYPLFVVIQNLDANGNITSTLTAYHRVTGADIISDEAEAALAKSDIELKYFPNPWGKELSIKYTLAKDENVKVSIYNYNGALVKTIVPSTVQAKGSYNYTVSGESVKPGVYFLKIEHGDKVISKKLIKPF
jgi:hypothetical protein